MNKAFEKILEKIENLKLPFPDECSSYYGNTNKLLDMVKEMVQEVEEEYNGGWIACSDGLPNNDRYILISFSNFSLPEIGRYEEDENGGVFYIGDEDESCTEQDLIVNAWMELPEPYHDN